MFKDKGGRVNFVPTLAVDEKQPDGSIIRKTAGTGIGTADLFFPFDFMKHQCQGFLYIAADGKSGRGRGMCEVLSSKGDRAAYITSATLPVAVMNGSKVRVLGRTRGSAAKAPTRLS